MDSTTKYSIKSSYKNDAVFPSFFPGNTQEISRLQWGRTGPTKLETPLMERQMFTVFPSISVETEPRSKLSRFSFGGRTPPSISLRLFTVVYFMVILNSYTLSHISVMEHWARGIPLLVHQLLHCIDVSITSTFLLIIKG